MALERGLDSQAVLDGLGQGTLVFDSMNRLVLINQAGRGLIGADVRSIRSEGWAGACAYFDRYIVEGQDNLNLLRVSALTSNRPVRFHIYRSGEMIPCWAAAVHGVNGEVYTMLTIETPDWTSISDVLRRYLKEVQEAVEATSGHAKLIEKSAQNPRANQSVEQVAKRVLGFARVIDIQMYRLRALTGMMSRLEQIRTGSIRDQVMRERRKIVLADFFEDFMETLEDPPLLDPETETDNYRARIKQIVPRHLTVMASKYQLTTVLRDVLRNAIMYSMRGTPVRIIAFAGQKDASVQIDVTDDGYGVRASEHERVFKPFERARQPQIISEFGYGLSLYLCKYEIEAMNGQLWFESQEGSGATFSMRLPAWREDSLTSSSSSDT